MEQTEHMKQINFSPSAVEPHTSLAENSLRFRLRRVKSNVVALVVGISAGFLGSSTAWADLPTVSDPTNGVTQGNYLQLAQNYFFDAVLLITALACTFALISVIKNALAVYHEVGEGKKKWGDLTTHVVVGVGLLVLTVFLMTEATTVLNIL